MADLKTRERVNMVIDRELMKELRQLSKSTGKPMSRYLDEGIQFILEINT